MLKYRVGSRPQFGEVQADFPVDEVIPVAKTVVVRPDPY